MTRAHFFATLWTLAILAACSIPGNDLPRVAILSIDKLAHFTVFVGFGGLWMWALQSPLSRRTKWVVFTGMSYAVLTEIYQGLLPFERTPDPLDALANILGLLTAVLIYYLIEKNQSR